MISAPGDADGYRCILWSGFSAGGLNVNNDNYDNENNGLALLWKFYGFPPLKMGGRILSIPQSFYLFLANWIESAKNSFG